MYLFSNNASKSLLVKSVGRMNKNMTADCIWQTIEEMTQRPLDHVPALRGRTEYARIQIYHVLMFYNHSATKPPPPAAAFIANFLECAAI